jgi:hypothetical protein
MSEQSIQLEEPGKKRGRPTEYNPSTVGKIIGGFQRGLSVKTVCTYAGIHPDTLYEWMNKHSEFSEKVSAARTYGTLLAAETIQDVLQDTQRDKKEKRYSEASRISTARWYLERQEREAFGSSGGVLGAKVETNDKGGTTATIVYATDEYIRDIIEKSTVSVDSGIEEIDPGQLLEISEDSSQEGSVVGGEDQGSTPQVHSEELRGEHTDEEGVPEP